MRLLENLALHSSDLSKCKLSWKTDQNRILVWFLYYINNHILYDYLFTSHHNVNNSHFQILEKPKYHNRDFTFVIDAI